MLNQCNFIGRLGRSPESKTLESGTTVTNFSIACGEKWKDKSGQWQEKTLWINLVAWERLGVICAEYLHKGSLVYVSGKMQTRSWEKDGEKRYATDVVIREMKMLDSKGSGQGQSANEKKAFTPVKEAEQQNMGSDVPF